MAKVPNAIEILPKIWTAGVGRTNVTDDRQTDRQTTDGRATAYSERESEFTFAKNPVWQISRSRWILRAGFLTQKSGRKSSFVQYPSTVSLPNGLANNTDRLARSTDSYSTVTAVFSNIYQMTAHAVDISYKKSLWHITMETMEENLQDYTYTTLSYS